MNNRLITLLTAIAMAFGMHAQTAWPVGDALYTIARGDQVTTASELVDGGLYLIYQPKNNIWANEDTGHALKLSGSDPAGGGDVSYVFRVTQTDGGYHIQTASGLYLPAPTANGTMASAATPGTYSLVFSEGYVLFRTTTDGTTYGIDRTNNQMYAYTSLNNTASNSSAQCFRLFAAELTPADPVITTLAELTTGWYRMSCTHDADAGRYAYTAEPELVHNSKNYPIAVQTEASTPDDDDARFFFRFTRASNGFYLKLPNGHDVNKASPTSFIGISTMTIAKDDNGFYFNSGKYFKPMSLGGGYALGETATDGARYALERVSLTQLGLTAWTVDMLGGVQDAALPANNTSVTYLGSDAKGLTTLYDGGTLFLPEGTVPTADDFTISGSTAGWVISVDASTCTIHAKQLGIVAQGYQTTSVGATQAMLLRLKLISPAEGESLMTGLQVCLSEGSRPNIESLEVYRCASAEVYAQDELELLGTARVGDSDVVTIPLGDTQMTDGYNQLWLMAHIAADASVGDVVNASVVSLEITADGEPMSIDLTPVGTTGQQGARIYAAQSYPFLPTTYGSNIYRIPALVAAPDGSLIAAADKRYNNYTDIGQPTGHVIDIVVRRSTDGGATWAEPQTIAKGLGSGTPAKCAYGDPSLTVDAAGRIYCLFAAGNIGYFYGLNRIGLCMSDDNGLTWTEPADLLDEARLIDHTATGLFDYFVTSGRGICTDDGILMLLLNGQPYTDEEQTAHASSTTNYVLYSTDRGSTWHIDGTPVYSGGDEAKLTQLPDGTLLASIRQGGGRGFNRGSYVVEADGTLTFTWGQQWQNSTLAQGGSPCNHDILRYDLGTDDTPTILLHTLTGAGFQNLRLYMSIDDGASWTEIATLQPGGARYATMTQLGNGDLGVLFEDGQLGQSTPANQTVDGYQYPINYITIRRDALVESYAAARTASLTAVLAEQGSTAGPTATGAFSGTGWSSQWTCSQPARIAGLTVSTQHNALSVATVYDTRVVALRPSDAGATDAITITAPAGYLIDSYTIGGFFYTATETYRLTSADGSQTADICLNSGTPEKLTVEAIYEPTATFTLTSLGASNRMYACITDFCIRLIEEDNPTGIGTPAGRPAATVPQGTAAAVYDLSGRRVHPGSHGVYIVGGKKVVR